MPIVALAVGTSTSPEKYQSKTSATPSFASATYPSRDIDMIATTLVIVQLLSRQGRGSSAVPAVLQLDDPAAGRGAGDQVESVGLGDAVEQPGALARNVGEQAHLELVDQVEPHERPPEADAAPDHDVAVAAQPELVDLFCRVTSGDGGVGPVGRLQGPGEDDLGRGVQDRCEGVVGGRCHGPGDALVGGAAHNVRVRAPEKVELLLVVGLTVFRQGEAELPILR